SQYLTALSLQYTTPVYFSLIVALSPVSVMLLAALFLKEPVPRRKTAGVALGVIGALVLISGAKTQAPAGTDNLLGIGLACVSIIAFSVYLIIMRSVAQKYSAVTQMKWMFMFTAMLLLPFGINDLPKQTILSSEWEWSGVLEACFVIFLASASGYFLMPFGMKYLRATTVSVYMNLQPIVASVTAIFIGQDIFSWEMPVAAVLVLLGAYTVSTSQARAQETDR
ncbi:MAG: DMT family transporter, partial [Duncaniella sp.]|nr:DMT family transporter [Duncaniella sp.]